MVSLQESGSIINCSNRRSNNSNNSKSQSWFMGRSMRTVRSNLYHHHSSPPSPKHTASSSSSSSSFNNNNNNNNNDNGYHSSSSSEILTDSVIDLRLGELAAAHQHKSDFRNHHHCGGGSPHNNNNNNNKNNKSSSSSESSDSESSSSFLRRLLLLQLDDDDEEEEEEEEEDFSQAFSACSSSDISGELHRLACASSSNTNNHYLHHHQQQPPPEEEEEEEPCPGFLERESFSSSTAEMMIMESISPEDLQPTVKICVDSLSSPSTAVRRSAAAKLRLLAKNRSDNRALIGESGAVPSLLLLLRSPDPLTQEHAVTALLNLSLHDDNRDLMSDPVAVKSLIYVLKTGTETSKQNAACALLNLSLTDEGTRMSIGACGAIPPLVSLLINGSTRGKKDALTTLYKLCGARVNKERAVSAGAVGPLVGMMVMQEQQQQGSEGGLAEKAMVVLSSLAGIGEGREAIVEEGGIAVLVEAIDHEEENSSKSHKVKEFAVMTLLQLCVGGGDDDGGEESVRRRKRNRGLLIREGGIPPLAALSQSGTLKAKHKAETLLRYLREPRQEEASTSAASP